MKVLILSVTAGEGHNAVAAALNDYFENISIECRTLDTLDYLNRMLAKTVSKGYLLSVASAKELYAKIYGSLENRKKNANSRSATRTTNMIFVKKLKKYIDIYAPDVIVCTHIFACIIIDIMKTKDMITAKTVGILTDFAFHPYWEETLHFDYIVVPGELLLHQARKKGFEDRQILPFGIPIHPKFSSSCSKEEARRSVGIDENRRTVLLMSGSMGYGNIVKTVTDLDNIDEDFQMITVCGNNAEAKASIDALTTKKPLLSLGYAHNVDVLMDAADCIITKPGGLTTSEALAKRLPMIIVNPIPGQEDRNTVFLLNNGTAMYAEEKCPIDEVLFEFLKHPERSELMRKSIDLIRKPDSTRDICEFIRTLARDTKPQNS